jgi:triosephosphate isomerase
VVSGLLNVSDDEIGEVVIAYEPVWAIGTGEFAVPDDVRSAASIIRSQVTHLYGREAGKALRILYGGSVNAGNARSFLEIDEVGGLLVGGASLNADEFNAIVDKAYETTKENE